MQANDVTLRMIAMNMLQQLQAGAGAAQTSDAGGAQQTVSFKDLMDQRRSDLADNGSQQTGTARQPADSGSADQPESDTDTAVSPEAAALAAGQMLLAGAYQPVQQVVTVQPEGDTAAAPVQMLVVEGGTMPADAAQQLGVPTGSDAQRVEAVFTETVSGQDTPTTLPLQPMQQPAAGESGEQTARYASDDLAQQLPQTDARKQDTQQAPVTVESWHAPLFKEVEASPVRVGDAPVDMTAPAGDVEKSLGDALKGALDRGDQFLELKLSPANLGNVVAQFTRSSDGALHVVLRADTEQAAKLLSSHASALSLLLQDGTNNQVRVDVPQPRQEQTPWQQQSQNQNGGQQQQQQQQQRNTSRREADSFLQQLRLGLVQLETQAV